jgi:hypothetical protein
VLIHEDAGSGHLKRIINKLFGVKDPEFHEFNDLAESGAHENRDYYALTQYGVFLFALTLLWIFSALNISTTLTLSLSLTMFFFIDDWVIISEYTNALRGRTLKSHRRRMFVADLLLVPGVLIASYLYLPWFIALPATVILALLLIYHWGNTGLPQLPQIKLST